MSLRKCSESLAHRGKNLPLNEVQMLWPGGALFGVLHYHGMADQLLAAKKTMPPEHWEAVAQFVGKMLKTDNPQHFDPELFHKVLTDQRYKSPSLGDMIVDMQRRHLAGGSIVKKSKPAGAKPTADWDREETRTHRRPLAVRETAKALCAERRLDERAPLYRSEHYSHMAKLLGAARNHMPDDKWRAIHDFIRTALTADNPRFGAGAFSAAVVRNGGAPSPAAGI